MKIIGHRGARGLAPENTIAGIKHALKYQVDEIELDVRVTRDGVPILHHNPSIELNNQSFAINSHSLADLLLVKPDLATLKIGLSAMSGKSIPHLEIKPGVVLKPIVLVIKESVESGEFKMEDMLLASKSQPTLIELHTTLPLVPKVIIESWSGVRAVIRSKQVDTKRISMRSWWLWGGFLSSMSKRGYLISAYTVNDPRTATKWRKYLYGIITDFPDRFTK